VDLAEWKTGYDRWYRQEYLPAYEKDCATTFYTFPEYLKKYAGCVDDTDIEIYEACP
jgi:hypothetical protein